MNNNTNEDKPLLSNTTAPIATAELDEMDNDDDRETVTEPYPGIDDGFFTTNNVDPDKGQDVPNTSRIPDIQIHPPDDDNDVPSVIITSRAGTDDEGPDEIDGEKKENGRPLSATPFKPNFPHWGVDVEGGSAFGGDIDIPDLNVYQHKKTLAQGMMDLALFSANANQLRYVLESNTHPYFYPSIVLISFSLIMQVAVGIGLILNSLYNVKDDKEICKANKINNFTVIGIFLVTAVNVFISAFGVGAVQPVTNGT